MFPTQPLKYNERYLLHFKTQIKQMKGQKKINFQCHYWTSDDITRPSHCPPRPLQQLLTDNID